MGAADKRMMIEGMIGMMKIKMLKQPREWGAPAGPGGNLWL